MHRYPQPSVVRNVEWVLHSLVEVTWENPWVLIGTLMPRGVNPDNQSGMDVPRSWKPRPMP